MENFFAKAGAYKGYKVEPHGTAPQREFIVVFSYENGTAAYDGKGWTFALNNKD